VHDFPLKPSILADTTDKALSIVSKSLEENLSDFIFCCLVSVVSGNGFGICSVERKDAVVSKDWKAGLVLKPWGLR